MGGIEYLPAKTILTRTKKGGGWFGTDYTMNLYRGFSHGCFYCDSRSACYGNDAFDRVRPKADALRILRDELRRRLFPGVVGAGAMSDPYNPLERQLQLSRHSLELLEAFGFGVAIATKSDGITRDIDLLQAVAARAPVLCKLTVTTVEPELAAKLEPGAPPPACRMAAVERLASAGLFTGVLLMPVLPFLEDREAQVLAVVRAAADSGARFVYPAFGVTLRDRQREYFYARLEELFPGQGLPRRYQQRYGLRYECHSPRAKALWQCFTAACQEAGLLYRMQEITASYRQGYEQPQLQLPL